MSLYSCGQPCLEINHWFTLDIGTFKKKIKRLKKENKTKCQKKKKKNTIIRPLFSIVKKQLTQFMSREDEV